jgi:hypothetical protein
MSGSPIPRSALRGDALGQALVCAAGRNSLPVPRRREPTQARAAGDVEAKYRRRDDLHALRTRTCFRTQHPLQPADLTFVSYGFVLVRVRIRRDEASAARRWRLESLRWRLCAVTLLHRFFRAGASALAALLPWHIGVIALVHVGIAVLRLGIAALARRERARDGAQCLF